MSVQPTTTTASIDDWVIPETDSTTEVWDIEDAFDELDTDPISAPNATDSASTTQMAAITRSPTPFPVQHVSIELHPPSTSTDLATTTESPRNEATFADELRRRSSAPQPPQTTPQATQAEQVEDKEPGCWTKFIEWICCRAQKKQN